MTALYDKVIVGGGIAGLATAYEILRMAKESHKPAPKVIVLADKISAPTEAGSNIVFGIDGFEDAPHGADATRILQLVRNSLTHLQKIVHEEKIDCRLDMRYQFLGSDAVDGGGHIITAQEAIEGTKAWAQEHFRYRSSDFCPISAIDRIGFKGFTAAEESKVIGQINVHELQIGLIRAIREMGGDVNEGTRYERHEASGDVVKIHTDKGIVESHTVPLLATGAAHLAHMGLPVTSRYTAAMHVKLSPEDARALSRDGNAVAFCDTNVSGDVFWGSLDSKDILTIGFGETDDPKNRASLEGALRKRFGELRPDFAGRYADKITYSFGPMAMTENKFPLVGRLPNFDVNGGWASRGIAGSFAAARAYAKWFVNGDEEDLKLFENLNVTGLRSSLESTIPHPNTRGETSEFPVLRQ